MEAQTRIEIDKLSAETLLKEFAELKNEIAELKKVITPNPDKLITVNEVCELLHISKSTVVSWQKQGILKKYKKGNRTYYKYSEVIEMFNNDSQ